MFRSIVDIARAEGKKVSSLHLRFLSPLEPGLKEIFSKFRKVKTVELNYSDAPDAPLTTARLKAFQTTAPKTACASSPPV